MFIFIQQDPNGQCRWVTASHRTEAWPQSTPTASESPAVTRFPPTGWPPPRSCRAYLVLLRRARTVSDGLAYVSIEEPPAGSSTGM